MHIKKFKKILIILLAVSVLGGCTGNMTGGKTESSKKIFTIVTSFYPMYVSTINVTRGIASVRVINMTKPQTGCLHDYQLTPQDLVTLESADAFVVNGAGMEAFLNDVISRQKNLKIIEASRGITLLRDPSGEYNPHVWVSITDAIAQVRNIAGQLSAVNAENAKKYESNANIYIAKLEALKTKMHASLAHIKTRDIITFHEAFPYFAQEFNLHIAAVIERDPGTAPTMKELAAIIDMVNKSKVKVLFAEPQYSPSAARTIAAETGAKIYSLDPAVQANTEGNAYNEYLNVMEANLISLKEALA